MLQSACSVCSSFQLCDNCYNLSSLCLGSFLTKSPDTVTSAAAAAVAAVVFSCSETATGYGRQCCNSLVPAELRRKKQSKTQKQEVDRCNLYLIRQVSVS